MLRGARHIQILLEGKINRTSNFRQELGGLGIIDPGTQANTFQLRHVKNMLSEMPSFGRQAMLSALQLYTHSQSKLLSQAQGRHSEGASLFELDPPEPSQGLRPASLASPGTIVYPNCLIRAFWKANQYSCLRQEPLVAGHPLYRSVCRLQFDKIAHCAISRVSRRIYHHYFFLCPVKKDSWVQITHEYTNKFDWEYVQLATRRKSFAIENFFYYARASFVKG